MLVALVVQCCSPRLRSNAGSDVGGDVGGVVRWSGPHLRVRKELLPVACSRDWILRRSTPSISSRTVVMGCVTVLMLAEATMMSITRITGSDVGGGVGGAVWWSGAHPWMLHGSISYMVVMVTTVVAS
eukprot:887756-Pelagomonas_calceolata.AAC.2